jgi:transcription elongation factor GreA
MARHHLTQSAYDRLKAEFDDLTTRGRIQVAEKIERAREMGDLSENGDYHAAKDEQGHMEARIRHLESILEDHEIVAQGETGRVSIGCVVTIVYDGDDVDMAEKYFIGHIEERREGVEIMSPKAPLGSALIDRRVEEWVEYEAPNGNKLRVRILDVEHHN